MGENAVICKEYFADNRRFADLFNMKLFNGEQVLSPEELSEQDASLFTVEYDNGYDIAEPTQDDISDFTLDNTMDTTHEARPNSKRGLRRKGQFKEKVRDNIRLAELRRSDRGVYFLLLGVEAQDLIHYAAPVKVMLYDAMNYDRQVKIITNNNRRGKKKGTSDEFVSGFHEDDRVMPVITLVVYLGQKTWTKPRRLTHMMELDNIDPRLTQYINDYPLHLIQPREMSETEINMLESDLKAVFGFLSNDNDDEKLEAFMSKNREIYENMDKDAVELINRYANVGIEVTELISSDGNGGNVNMCVAIQEMKRKSIEQGRVQGEDLFAVLTKILIQNGRTDDLLKATEDKQYRRQLFQEYQIS